MKVLSAGQDLAVFISVRLMSDQRRPISCFNVCLPFREKSETIFQFCFFFFFFVQGDPDGGVITLTFFLPPPWQV